MANLVIVESPTKSKTIGRFLGKNYTVKASMGHLRDLPKSQFGVDVDHDFEPKYINIRGKGDLIKELKTLAKKRTRYILQRTLTAKGKPLLGIWAIYWASIQKATAGFPFMKSHLMRSKKLSSILLPLIWIRSTHSRRVASSIVLSAISCRPFCGARLPKVFRQAVSSL